MPKTKASGKRLSKFDVIRNFGTTFEFERRHRCIDYSCCGQKRLYTPITTAAHRSITYKKTNASLIHPMHTYGISSDVSSHLFMKQIREKSDISRSDDESKTTTQVPVASVEDEDSTNNKNSLSSIPGSQKGGRKLAIVFTCTVCDTRSIKQFTENAYTNGVVIVQCPGCQNRHLIADNLGFFEDEKDGWNIEKALIKMGENVQLVDNDNVMELSVKDIFGAENTNIAANSEDSSYRKT